MRSGLNGLTALFLLAFVVRANAADAAPDHPSQDGLVLWLDASDAASITADAQGRVSKWVDHSGRSYAVTAQSQEASQPVKVAQSINGKPAIHFKDQQVLSGGTALREAAGPFAIFIVARQVVDPSHPGRIEPLFTFSNVPLHMAKPGQLDDPGTLSTATTVGKPGDTTIYYAEAASIPMGPFMLGKNPAMDTAFFNGDIAEVLIYDRTFLSAGERQLVTEYLHAKWNAVTPLAPGEWTREGPLGPTPEHTHQDLPLSDQENKGQWVLDSKFSDDFKEKSLDLHRWVLAPEVPSDPGWRGRQPALFLRSNTTLTNGMLEITDRKGDVPEMAQYPGQGYAGYTTGFIQTDARSGYGYYEIKAKPHNSAFCSAFWMTDTGLKDTGTEIDIFEIGAKAHNREYDDNMTAHVWGTPQDKRHWAVGSRWKAPWKLGADFHVYGFEWNKDELRWYVDGVLVHKLKNTNWFYPMRIVFDSEPMWQWFGKVDDADLPSTFDVQYLRVWRQDLPSIKM